MAVTVNCRTGVVLPGHDGVAVTVDCRTGVVLPGHDGVAVTVDCMVLWWQAMMVWL